MRFKRAFTLMEIIIVIFLIGIISGVISYNMRGSIENGRAFRTEQAMSQIKDILEMEIAKGEFASETIVQNPAQFLERSGLVKDPKKFARDGWNQHFEITANASGRVNIISRKLQAYKAKQKRALGGIEAQSIAEPDETENDD